MSLVGISADNIGPFLNEEDQDALFNYTLKQARECAFEVENLEHIIVDNNEGVDNSKCAFDVVIVKEEEVEEVEETTSPEETIASNTFVADDISSDLDTNSTTFQCNLCYQVLAEYGSFLNHLRETHEKRFESKAIKHNYKAPNLDQFNRYCEACEIKCISHRSYQLHLRKRHYILPRFDYANSMDTTYNCRVCSKNFKTVQRYTIHLKCAHNKNYPSADNSNNYCRICKITYLTHALFRKHLEYEHTTHRRDTDPKRLPEITTPYNYCHLCEKQYKKNTRYIQHLQNRHNMNLIQTPDKLPDLPDLGFLCLFCHLKFDSRDVFQDHCKSIHKVDSNGVITLYQELLDPGDLYFYCTACDQTFEQKPDYQTHFSEIHVVKYALPSNPLNKNIPNNYGLTTESTAIQNTKNTAIQDNEEPDIHAHDYCRAYIEKIISTSTSIASDTLPDPDNPDFYCCICKKTKKSAKRYRKHCRKTHLMKLKRKK